MLSQINHYVRTIFSEEALLGKLTTPQLYVAIPTRRSTVEDDGKGMRMHGKLDELSHR